MSDNVVRLHVNTDDVSPEEQEALARLLAPFNPGGADSEDEVFDDIDDLLVREAKDEAGAFYPYPAIPGMEVHITGSLQVATAVQQAEKRLREVHYHGNAKKALSHDENLQIAAIGLLKGGGVKGWRGARRGGQEWPFSHEAFTELYRASKRFREFVIGKFNVLSNVEKANREGVRGE